MALPDVALDPSSAQEGRVIRAAPPFLEPVFAGAHWRVYRGARRDAAAERRGAAAERWATTRFTLRAGAPGWLTVRVRYTRYWTVSAGRAASRKRRTAGRRCA